MRASPVVWLVLGGFLVASPALAGSEQDRVARIAGRLQAIDNRARYLSRPDPARRTVQFTRRVLGIPWLRLKISPLRAGARALSDRRSRQRVEARIVERHGRRTRAIANEGRRTLQGRGDWSKFAAEASQRGAFSAADLDTSRPYEVFEHGFDPRADRAETLRQWSRASRRETAAKVGVGVGAVLLGGGALAFAAHVAGMVPAAFGGWGLGAVALATAPIGLGVGKLEGSRASERLAGQLAR